MNKKDKSCVTFPSGGRLHFQRWETMASGTRAALRRQMATSVTHDVAPVAAYAPAPTPAIADEHEFYKTFGIVPTKRDRSDVL